MGILHGLPGFVTTEYYTNLMVDILTPILDLFTLWTRPSRTQRAWLVAWFLTSSSTTRLYRGRIPRLTSGNFTCCHTRDREGRPCLLLCYTDTDPTSSEWAATAGIEPRTSSPRVTRSSDWATAPPNSESKRSLIYSNFLPSSQAKAQDTLNPDCRRKKKPSTP